MPDYLHKACPEAVDATEIVGDCPAGDVETIVVVDGRLKVKRGTDWSEAVEDTLIHRDLLIGHFKRWLLAKGGTMVLLVIYMTKGLWTAQIRRPGHEDIWVEGPDELTALARLVLKVKEREHGK